MEGTFSPSDFTGLLRGKQMSDLIKMILDGNVYVRVQTLSAPLGEIQGKVEPQGLQGEQTNALAQSQNQSNASGQKGQFFADLTGQGVTPPRTTNATGKATFAVTDGANKMSYSVKADINKVTDVFLSASSGGRYNDLVVLRVAQLRTALLVQLKER